MDTIVVTVDDVAISVSIRLGQRTPAFQVKENPASQSDQTAPEPPVTRPLGPNPPDPKPNPSILVPLTEGEKLRPRPLEKQTRKERG